MLKSLELTQKRPNVFMTYICNSKFFIVELPKMKVEVAGYAMVFVSNIVDT